MSTSCANSVGISMLCSAISRLRDVPNRIRIEWRLPVTNLQRLDHRPVPEVPRKVVAILRARVVAHRALARPLPDITCILSEHP